VQLYPAKGPAVKHPTRPQPTGLVATRLIYRPQSQAP
jgi:hypothetical protein